MANVSMTLAIPVLRWHFPSLKRVRIWSGHLFSLKPKPLPLVATGVVVVLVVTFANVFTIINR